MCLSFFAENVILELKCTKSTSLELLRTPILCFSATKQIMRMRGHRRLKNLFLSEKKLLICNFKSKAQAHEKIISNEINSFLQCKKTDFHVF